MKFIVIVDIINRIGTCVAYLTDSDTIKKYWYWPDTDTDTRIGAALLISMGTPHHSVRMVSNL